MTGRGIQAVLGNLPFLGGRRIATVYGEPYADWLTGTFTGTGDTDYVGYFLLRSAELSAQSAGLGLIATNAIAEGDNRRTVVCPMLERRAMEIYRAQTGIPWPGNATVLVALLQFARGTVRDHVAPRLLNGRVVSQISSRLRGTAEWPDPLPVPANKGLALVGCFLRGDGFVLEPDEAQELLQQHPHESAVVRRFLVGDDLNSTPDQSARRWVIDFADRSLEEARSFPASLRLIEQRVRPSRERLKTTGADADHRKYWWRFANVRKELRERTAGLTRMLATARVSKHSMFAFIDPDQVPSEQVVVFPIESWTAFAVLQSRIHGAWVQMNATHMGEGIRYSASECFETFPFPMPTPAAAVPSLEAIGEQLYAARSRFMAESGHGLTKTHNAMVDPERTDAAVRNLRSLAEELDRAVVAAYGWDGLEVPSYCSASEADGIATSAFEDAVIDRLCALNATAAPIAPAPTRRRRTKSSDSEDNGS